MTFTWYDMVGSLGVLLVLAAYLLLQMRKLSADSLMYSVVNALGAGCILVSLFKDFNFSAAAIETAWLAISIWGVILYYSRNNSSRNNHSQNNRRETTGNES